MTPLIQSHCAWKLNNIQFTFKKYYISTHLISAHHSLSFTMRINTKTKYNLYQLIQSNFNDIISNSWYIVYSIDINYSDY